MNNPAAELQGIEKGKELLTPVQSIGEFFD